MAKKKSAISDLIKSDMSRRAIGEETEILEEAEPAPAVTPVKPSEEKPAPPKQSAAPKKERPAVLEGGGDLDAFILAQTQSVELTNEEDMSRFYDFLKCQITRYIRGYDAGRRFHG
ncbi:MAG: hypothetical protein FWH38_08575 [Treponema sp.]|nr:hypothetical protein [Treponema sp.]